MKLGNYILIIIILAILLIGLGFVLGGRYNVDRIENLITKKQTITKYDTAVVYKVDTLIINKSKIKTVIKEKIDTVVVINAFEKIIDTSFNDNKLLIKYCFPEDSFFIDLRVKENYITRTDTVKTYITIPMPQKNYNLEYYIGAFGLGLVLGVIAK